MNGDGHSSNVLVVMTQGALALGESILAAARDVVPLPVALSRYVLPPDGIVETNFRRSVSRPSGIVLCLDNDPSENAMAFQSVRGAFGDAPMIVAANPRNSEQLFALLRLGPADFMLPPFSPLDLLLRLSRSGLQSNAEANAVRALKERLGLEYLVGESPAMFEACKKIPPVAQCDASVLITGETGTGKELFARAIHYLSRRSAKPFVPVNTGAIPCELVENELFGHERGAFTGAVGSSSGLIREAEGGTLFLDEIDSLPSSAQVKLLRFLQEKEFRPLGSSKGSKADVRVIAAANCNLAEASRAGRFREDLFFRLNVIPFDLPPLRKRTCDIPLLARHFLRKFAREFDRCVYDFTSEALLKLQAYLWPGNVRELENIVQRAVVLSERGVIRSEELDLPGVQSSLPLSFRELKARAVAEFERGYIEEALGREGGNIARAAKAAQKNRRAFWELMRKHRLHVHPNKSLKIGSAEQSSQFRLSS